MKKLSERDFDAAHKSFVMPSSPTADYQKAPHVFEVKGHDTVTIDMSPNFIQAAASFKKARDSGIPVKLYRISNTTGRKTEEYVNPNY